MTIRFSIVSLAVVAAAILPSTATASITSDFRGANTGPFPSLQNDNDFSYEQLLVDNNGNGIVDVGDSVWGVATFESIGRFSGGALQRLATGQGAANTTEFTAIFATQVLSKAAGPGPGLSTFTMGPDATFNTLFGNSPGTMIAFFDDVAKDFSATAPLGAAPVNYLDPGNIFQVASDGLRVMEVGFTGAGGVATGGEGWSATAPDDPSLLPPPGGAGAGNYFGSLNVLLQANGYEQFVIPFVQVSAFGPAVQFNINGAIYSSVGTTFPIGDDANTFWQIERVIPEPSAALVWGLLLGITACVKPRRRK